MYSYSVLLNKLLQIIPNKFIKPKLLKILPNDIIFYITDSFLDPYSYTNWSECLCKSIWSLYAKDSRRIEWLSVMPSNAMNLAKWQSANGITIFLDDPNINFFFLDLKFGKIKSMYITCKNDQSVILSNTFLKSTILSSSFNRGTTITKLVIFRITIDSDVVFNDIAINLINLESLKLIKNYYHNKSPKENLNNKSRFQSLKYLTIVSNVDDSNVDDFAFYEMLLNNMDIKNHINELTVFPGQILQNCIHVNNDEQKQKIFINLHNLYIHQMDHFTDEKTDVTETNYIYHHFKWIYLVPNLKNILIKQVNAVEYVAPMHLMKMLEIVIKRNSSL